MPENDYFCHAFNTGPRIGNDYYTYGSDYWFCHKCQTWICGDNYHTCSRNHPTAPSDNQKIIQLLERIANALELKHKRG